MLLCGGYTATTASRDEVGVKLLRDDRRNKFRCSKADAEIEMRATRTPNTRGSGFVFTPANKTATITARVRVRLRSFLYGRNVTIYVLRDKPVSTPQDGTGKRRTCELFSISVGSLGLNLGRDHETHVKNLSAIWLHSYRCYQHRQDKEQLISSSKHSRL